MSRRQRVPFLFRVRVPRTPLERIWAGGTVLAATVLLGVLGWRAAGRSWSEAAYMVAITVSTVGFAERSELSAAEQWLTVGVIVLGISAAAVSIGGFFQMMTEGEIDRALALGRTTRSIDKLSGHVIVCGYGRLGRTLTEELDRRKQPVVVVDNRPEAIADAQAQDYLVLLGDATDESVLLAAGVERAKCLVSALASDAANVFITLTSRNLNRQLLIIARGEQQSTQKKLLQAGANRVVLPAVIGAQRIAAMITHPSTLELMELVAGRSVLDVEIDEFPIGPASTLVGQTIHQAETRRKHGLLVVAVKKTGGNMVFNPDADLVFQAGDIAIVMGRVEDIERFRREYGIA